ncbi:MAG: hypothetical protein KatS3mg109_2374 [Pirellulaceae bacterium]|nr:MAG: hypothetical protein KatS3mg109_2374 [Pirellulaceae bacterium]
MIWESERPAHVVRWSADGKWLAAGDPTGVWLCDADGRNVRSLPTGVPTGIAAGGLWWASDSRHLWCRYDDGAVRQWDTQAATAELIAAPRQSTPRVAAWAWHPAGGWAQGSDDGTTIYDASGQTTSSIPLAATALAFSPDGEVLFAANGQGIFVWDVEAKREQGRWIWTVSGQLSSGNSLSVCSYVDATRTGDLAVVLDGQVHIIKADLSTFVASIPCRTVAITQLVIDPAGSWISCRTEGSDATAHFWSSHGESLGSHRDLNIFAGYEWSYKHATDLFDHIADYACDWSWQSSGDSGFACWAVCPDQALAAMATGPSLVTQFHGSPGGTWFPRWHAVLLPGAQSIALAASGQILSGDPSVVQTSLVYYVDRGTGQLELLDANRFAQEIAILPPDSQSMALTEPSTGAPSPPSAVTPSGAGRVLVVGTGPNEIPDLNAAFQQAQPNDTILIRHRGPLEIAPVDLTGKTPLTIVGDSREGVDYWPIVRQRE